MRRFRPGPVLLTLLLSACDPSVTPAQPGAAGPVPSASVAGAPATATPVPPAKPTPSPTPVPTPVASAAPPVRVTGATVEGYVFKYVDRDFPPSPPLPPVSGAYVSGRSKTLEKPYFQDVQRVSPNYTLTGVPLDADIEITAVVGNHRGTVQIHTGGTADRKFVPIEMKLP
ncbi:MAG: hypothetical protein H7338_22980 [Candidatus Sericytochromatia bacterium]|nr:hypothetical protein [Candidatus Sericytochromatia bacterium]